MKRLQRRPLPAAGDRATWRAALLTGLFGLTLLVAGCRQETTTDIPPAPPEVTIENGQMHVDRQLGFALEYPEAYALETTEAEGYFELRQNDQIALSGAAHRVLDYLEPEDYDGSDSAFQAFAVGLSRMTCDADGPETSVSCERPDEVHRFTNSHDLRGVRFFLTMVERQLADGTEQRAQVGPFHVLDISRPDQPAVLLLQFPHGQLATEVQQMLAAETADTVRLLPES